MWGKDEIECERVGVSEAGVSEARVSEAKMSETRVSEARVRGGGLKWCGQSIHILFSSCLLFPLLPL